MINANMSLELEPQESGLKPSDDGGAGSPFGDLPFEMIAAVFDHLSSVERQKIRSVSHSWNQIVIQLFETVVQIRNSNLEALCKTEGKFLCGELFGEPEELNFEFQQFDTFCSRLLKLKFSGIILPANVLHMLRRCQTLQKLTFDNVDATTNVLAQSIAGPGKGFNNVISLTCKCSCRFGWKASMRNLFRVVAECLENGILGKIKISLPCYVEHYSHRDVLRLDSAYRNPDLISYRHNFACDCSCQELMETLTRGNQATRRLLKLGRPDNGYRLQFYPPVTAPNSMFRVERFSGAQYFFCGRTTPPTPDPLLQLLLRQDVLKELSLQFFGMRQFPELHETIETAVSQIMQRNLTTLTSVKLRFCVMEKSANRSCGFGGALQQCTNLQLLALQHRSDHLLHPNLQRLDPIFTGMTELPASLKYFETDFSLGILETGMEEVDLSNLVNLETLKLSANRFFVFDGDSSPDSKMTADEFNALRSKLGALKEMVLRIGTYPLDIYGRRSTETMEYGVTPELIKMFQNHVVNEKDEQYLKMRV